MNDKEWKRGLKTNRRDRMKERREEVTNGVEERNEEERNGRKGGSE